MAELKKNAVNQILFTMVDKTYLLISSQPLLQVLLLHITE